MSETEEKRGDKPPTGSVWALKGERLRNYAAAIAILLGALPAIGSLIVSVTTAYRGEPVAEKTWTTLRDQVNKQSESINKLHLRLVHFQGVQEGQTLSDLQHKLDDLQRRYDLLSSSSSSQNPEPDKCRDGHVFAGGRCRAVSQAVDDLVKQKEQEAAEAKRKAEEEMKRRLEEQKKRIEQTQKLSKPAPPSLLKSLPKHLDDAVKK